jgi:hypothetical protein
MAAIFEHSKLAPVPRLVLLALADHADHDGYAWPAIDRLAHKTGLHRRTVQIALAESEAAGELTREMGGGRHNTTLYRITVGPVDNSVEKGGAAPPLGEKGWRSVPKRVAESARKGGAAPPESSRTVIEPRRPFSISPDSDTLPPPDPDVVERVAELRDALKGHPAGLKLVEDEGPA